MYCTVPSLVLYQPVSCVRVEMIPVILVFSFFITKISAESCYYQRCLGCHPNAASIVGSSVECYPENWVTAEWIHNIGHPPPSTSSRVPIQYRCLKMVAAPDSTSSRTIDIIRGCIPKVQEDSVCRALEAVERARGHSNVRCYTCWGDDCNATTRIHAATTLLLVIICVLFVFR